MTMDERLEAQALLTRGADLEAQRQAARRAHNVDHERRIENELRAVWRRYLELEPPA